MNPLILRALLQRAASSASRFMPGMPKGGPINSAAGAIQAPSLSEDLSARPTAPFADSEIGKAFSSIKNYVSDIPGRLQQHAAARDQLGVDEKGFEIAYPDPMKRALMEANPQSYMDGQPSAPAPTAPVYQPPPGQTLVGQSPRVQPAFNANQIPGYNPAIGNMADPRMSADSLGQGVRSRMVSDGNGGMMNDFYLQGPSATGPDLVKKFMAYMHDKNPGTA